MSLAVPSGADLLVRCREREGGECVFGNLHKLGGTPSLTWREFLRQAREYLPSARSPHLAPLLAVRAERLYGIPRVKAEARIRGGMSSRGPERGARPLDVLESLSVDVIGANGNSRLAWNDHETAGGWIGTRYEGL